MYIIVSEHFFKMQTLREYLEENLENSVAILWTKN